MSNVQSFVMKFVVNGDNFASAGEASESVKHKLKQLGIDSNIIRKVAISMYEAEINMVIHAQGGVAEVEIFADHIVMKMTDKGPGIADIDKAMQEGYSTATDNIRELGFGAGMGLPNMKKYSDDMQIRSVVGQGTTVVLTINF